MRTYEVTFVAVLKGVWVYLEYNSVPVHHQARIGCAVGALASLTRKHHAYPR